MPLLDHRQAARSVLMIRPRHFSANLQTMASNAFQAAPGPAEDLQAAAAAEFDEMVNALGQAGVRVIAVDDTDQPAKPDAVFPNNWISTHTDGTVILYAMEAPSRRPERRDDVVTLLRRLYGAGVRRVIDLSDLEREGYFLEGTGSLVLDRPAGVAYAGLSSRTHPEALSAFAERTGYTTRAFATRDASGRPVYHTNVMLSIGSRCAVICTAVIAARHDRTAIREGVAMGGRTIVEISMDQMSAFAGNLLELETPKGPLLVLSTRALESLDNAQRTVLERNAQLLPVDIPTIENAGGGSVRCMMAEIFLPELGGNA